MKLKRWQRVVPALAVVLLLTAAGCAAGNDDAAPTTPSNGTTGDDILVVEAKEYEFDPSELAAEAGTFTVELRNVGIVEHDFVVEGVDDPEGTEHIIPVLPGESDRHEYTLEAGTYTFYCSIPGHRQLGMEGTLVVSG